MADWGAAINLEFNFAIYSTNNTFLNGLAKSYFSHGIGTGSAMIMSGGIDFQYSTYFGNKNKYLGGFGENRGHINIFIHK